MDILQIILEEFYEKINDFIKIIPRNITFPNINNKIFVTIGMRRTGKTYFLLQTINKLLDSGISLKQILYLNFEDDRLYPLTQEKLRQLLDGFYSLYPENHDKQCYFFLDEIQNVTDWPIVIRRYFDTKKVQIYLSGSSAKLLSKEIATSLRGRSIATEIWPFSFNEYLKTKNLPSTTKITGKKYFDQMKALLSEYLNNGGFPETINLPEKTDRIRILQDYVDVVIFRDIIERYKITNIVLVKYLLQLLLKNSGTFFSVNKIFNNLKSQGFSVGKNTIYEYLSYFEDAYLIFSVPLFSESVRKSQTNPHKIFTIDSGLSNAYTLTYDKNLGHLFENLVYLDLRRRQHKIYYYLTKNRHEVDFVTKDLNGKSHLYQVVWNIEDATTFERETRALDEASEELQIKGEIITPEFYLKNFLSL